jgi:hypothetical protein
MRRPGAQRWTRSAPHGSPATISVRSSGSSSAAPGTGSAARIDGVRVSVSMRWLRSSSSSIGPGRSCSGVASTSVAPLSRAIRISLTAASKLRLANCSTRLPGLTSNAAICAVARLHTPRCSMSTPLGRPVEPEV